MELSDKKGVQQIVLSLAAFSLKEVVIAPGSRNAPFVLSFNRHPNFHCTSIRDERAAAFFALGKAIELQEPVILLCTSGSAALSFAPAIAEAYYQRIPLIVITADRPKSWTHQGDGQTMNQTNIYQNYIRKSFDLDGDATEKEDLWWIRRMVGECYHIATQQDKGPIHLNVPLKEPLYNAAALDISLSPSFQMPMIQKELSEQLMQDLALQYSACQKVMVLVGQQLIQPQFEKLLIEWSQKENVIILAESTSNLHHPHFIKNIDRCITPLDAAEEATFQPDLLITFGGAIVSKRIKAFLRKSSLKAHWNIQPFDAMMDTYQSLSHSIAMDGCSFLQQMLPRLSGTTSNFRFKWWELNEKTTLAHLEFMKQAAYSDLKAFDLFYQQLPEGKHLHLANSSTIRYAQLFDNQNVASSWSNRGTSGIDGCTSTAMGAAAASREKNFILITGDVSFYYDINGFWNEEHIHNLNVIILNNEGGNIFRIIPGPRAVAECGPYFETTLKSEARQIAQHYGWDYLSAQDESSLIAALQTFFADSTKRTILEIFTKSEENPRVLDAYWQFIKSNI